MTDEMTIGNESCSSTPCYAWRQRLAMSMERYHKIKRSVELTLKPGEYAHHFQKIPDGDRGICYWGDEKSVRVLAKKHAARFGVKWWRLEPLWKWSHLYDGKPARKDNEIPLIRI